MIKNHLIISVISLLELNSHLKHAITLILNSPLTGDMKLCELGRRAKNRANKIFI